MLNLIVDVVEKMRASSMDDQRFIAQVAPRLNMTPKEPNNSLDSFPQTESGSVHSGSQLIN